MLENVYHWLSTHSFLRIPLSLWLVAALVTVLGFVLVMSAIRIIAGRLRKRIDFAAHPTAAVVVAALERTKSLLILLLFASIGAHSLAPTAHVHTVLSEITAAVLAIQVGLWLSAAIRCWTRRKLNDESASPRNPVVMSMISWLLLVLVWTTLLMVVLSFMRVNITAFVASLGVGGVAVALALQNVLGDLFASMAIGLDKPFEIGHFINFKDISGTIEHVGVKTTRIRAISGEEVIISNAELLKNTIHNYGRMTQRRIVFGFGVTYDTDRSKLAELPGIVRGIIEDQDKTRVDRVHFKAFGDNALEYEVVYFVLDAAYGLYMDIQQATNLAMVERFEKIGVKFALPNRILHVSGEAGRLLQSKAATDEDAVREDKRSHIPRHASHRG